MLLISPLHRRKYLRDQVGADHCFIKCRNNELVMFYEFCIIKRNTEWNKEGQKDDKKSNNFLYGNMLQIILFFG
jgi:hypothetical protein